MPSITHNTRSVKCISKKSPPALKCLIWSLKVSSKLYLAAPPVRDAWKDWGGRSGTGWSIPNCRNTLSPRYHSMWSSGFYRWGVFRSFRRTVRPLHYCIEVNELTGNAQFHVHLRFILKRIPDPRSRAQSSTHKLWSRKRVWCRLMRLLRKLIVLV